MKTALDTSVLVRILANKPQPLATNVIANVARRIANGEIMVISDLVLSEAYYAMQHHYGVDKHTVLASLLVLSEEPGLSSPLLPRVFWLRKASITLIPDLSTD